jgi:cytochrome c2
MNASGARRRGSLGPGRRPGRAALGIGLLAAGCALVVPSEWSAATPARFPDVAAGQALIQEKGCANCHGILGPGGRQGPDLLRTARGKGAADLLADMWNHVPQMVAALLAGERLPSLTAAELRDLVGYLNFINYLGDPGDVGRGGAELVQMPCLACHDLRQRGKIGPALMIPGRAASPVGLVTDLWNHYPGMHVALRERGLQWFAWSGDLLTDLSRHLESLVPASTPAPLLAPGEPQEGSRVFARLGCGGCHGPSGAAAWAALMRRSNARSAAENGAALLRHLPALGGARQRLSEKEMADLLAYLSLAGAELPGGDAGAGRRVFERKRCGTCHALPGGKPGIGPNVQNMPAIGDPYQVASLMMQHARNMKTATELKHVPWPQMEPDELLDLYAFFAAQPRR